MTLYNEMKKLNKFGQRDDPPSSFVIHEIHQKIDNLIFDVNIKLRSPITDTKPIKFDEIVKRLWVIDKEMHRLTLKLSDESIALWEEITRLEKEIEEQDIEEEHDETRRIMMEDRD